MQRAVGTFVTTSVKIQWIGMVISRRSGTGSKPPLADLACSSRAELEPVGAYSPFPAREAQVSVVPTLAVGPARGTAKRTARSRAAASAITQPAWLSPTNPVRVA